MEETDLLKMAGVSTTGVAILLIVYRILRTIKGKKLVSKCCGKKIELGVDVEEMTPKADDMRSNPIFFPVRQVESNVIGRSEALPDTRVTVRPADSCGEAQEGKEAPNPSTNRSDREGSRSTHEGTEGTC